MERVQAHLARVIYIQVAVATEFNPNLMIYWPKCRYVSWGAGPNKSRATNRHKKCTFNPYLAVQIGSVTFRNNAQHKGKHGATATWQWHHSDKH